MTTRSFRWMALTAALLLGLLLVGAVAADHTPDPTSVTIAGDLQSEAISGACGDWDPACAATHLTYDAIDDVWQGTFGLPAGNWQPDCLRSWLQDPDGDGTYEFVTTDIPAGDYEAKAALNEGWGENYPAGNVPFTVPNDGMQVTFRFVSASNTFTISAGHSLDNNVEYYGLGHNSHDTL